MAPCGHVWQLLGTLKDVAHGTVQNEAPGCDVLLSNPAYNRAMDYLEHAWSLGFRLVVFLLPPSFLHSADRLTRMHRRGHLRRYYPIAERLQGMHDAAYIKACKWFTEAECEVYGQEYARSGWTGSPEPSRAGDRSCLSGGAWP